MCCQLIRALCVPTAQGATHHLLLVMWRCLPPHSPPVSLVPLAWPHCLPFLQPHPPLRRTVPLELRSARGLCVRCTLCPDCWLHWARSIAACPRRRAVPVDEGLLMHLPQTAEQCQVGAGQSASLAPSLRLKHVRLKHVRRWLLASICPQNGTTRSPGTGANCKSRCPPALPIHSTFCSVLLVPSARRAGSSLTRMPSRHSRFEKKRAPLLLCSFLYMTPFRASGPYRPSSGPNPLSSIFGPLVAVLYHSL